MLTWKTVRLGVIAALALFALALLADANAEDTIQHERGRIKVTVECGDFAVQQAISALTFNGTEVYRFVSGRIECDAGGTGSATFTHFQKWNDLHFRYHCPPNGIGPEGANTLEIAPGKVELDTPYKLNCPSTGVSHAPGLILAGDATVSITEVSNVGGIAELPEVAGTPLETDGSSGASTGVLAGIVAAIAAGTVSFGGAAWYARRRFTRG